MLAPVTLTDELWCWGEGSDGATGQGGTGDEAVPVRVSTTGTTTVEIEFQEG